MLAEGALFGERGKRPEEDKLAGLVHLDQSSQEEAAEQRTKNPHGQQEGRTRRYPSRAVRRYAAARHDHVDVRVMREG